MEMSATLALPSLPRTSPFLSFASGNSVFFSNGRVDIMKQKKNTTSCLVLSRSRARRGLNCTCLFGLGVPELVVIAGVAALVFGPKKLPEVGRSIGKTVKSFQQAAKEFETELKKEPGPTMDSAIDSSSEKPTASVVSEDEKKDVKVSNTTESS
ncbi:sec-independent protein translocase protein TATA, chloroplastic [Macadamia integrifolia]|uniref:sec-independent protein translocase protein TATA, chloroplastic n=1 Tax=Macadamia integrifolia TaxID=60698 RepID=UPI001C5019E4|nr:sec-independent protein translocase protein TATA, chloroplastic [Macadamia integrifolia]